VSDPRERPASIPGPDPAYSHPGLAVEPAVR
jgi:hypothetical protein